MTRNREICQSAQVLIDWHGEDGAIDHCDKRILHIVGSDDIDGAGIWKGIGIAVKHLLGAHRGQMRLYIRLALFWNNFAAHRNALFIVSPLPAKTCH
jgi:hypothetical protein